MIYVGFDSFNRLRCTVKWPSDAVYNDDYARALRAIRALLAKPSNPDAREPLPDTYEKIYASCRAVVTAAHKGEGLYDHVKQEVERCVGNVAQLLVHDNHQGVQWLAYFSDICKWFEQQVVRSRFVQHLIGTA